MSVLIPETDLDAPAPEASPSAPEIVEREPLLTANFCARGNHGPCQGMVYQLAGPAPAVQSCECQCHAGKTIKRARNQW